VRTGTLWEATTAPSPPFGPASGHLEADVAIVGGGFLGLSAALALAEAGVAVTLLEAGEIGAGASGQNAGFVVPHFSRADPATLHAALPGAHAEALLSLVSRGGDLVFALAGRLGLGRDAQQTGWLQPAHSAAAAEAIRRRVALWQERGRPVRFLSREDIAARTGMAVYHGALEDSSGGAVNPLALARGMARLAAQAGAAIHVASPVASVRREGGGFRLDTGRAHVRAERVLVATNAASAGAARGLGRTVVPLTVYQIATEPMAPAVVERIAPRRQPVSDTRVNIFTYRLDARDRLISGGMALVPLAAEGRMARRIAARLAAELELPGVPRVDFAWRGTAAMTRDALPALVEHAPGLFGAVGCNGRGVGFTTSFGRALGEWLAAGADPRAAPLPTVPERPVPLRGLARLAPSAVLLKGILADRRAMRQG